jgi:hypothetical protein
MASLARRLSADRLELRTAWNMCAQIEQYERDETNCFGRFHQPSRASAPRRHAKG